MDVGFHLRFDDISRGGIRIIKSRDTAAYNKNLSTLFAENYGLAYTQNKKNKDIPEFGSKGTVLLHQENQANALLAFQKYCSGMLDLLIPHKVTSLRSTRPSINVVLIRGFCICWNRISLTTMARKKFSSSVLMKVVQTTWNGQHDMLNAKVIHTGVHSQPVNHHH
jgi:hypothetical protein